MPSRFSNRRRGAGKDTDHVQYHYKNTGIYYREWKQLFAAACLLQGIRWPGEKDDIGMTDAHSLPQGHGRTDAETDGETSCVKPFLRAIGPARCSASAGAPGAPHLSRTMPRRIEPVTTRPPRGTPRASQNPSAKASRARYTALAAPDRRQWPSLPKLSCVSLRPSARCGRAASEAFSTAKRVISPPYRPFSLTCLSASPGTVIELSNGAIELRPQCLR